MRITAGQLNLSGWLSITSAVVTIPIVGLSIVTVAGGSPGGKAVNVILAIVGLALFIYLFSALKELLNSRFRFYDVDRYISALIWTYAISSVLGIFSLSSGQSLTLIDVVAIAAIMLYGIIMIVFAVKVLSLPNNLYGLLKPFCYSSIVTALSMTSIILIPLGLLVSMAQDVILGMIFFRAAAELSDKRDSTVETEKSIRVTLLKRSFCSGCGEQVHEGDKFCANCGVRVVGNLDAGSD